MGIVEQGLGHLFITSNTSHFFNKTDLEHYRSELCGLFSCLGAVYNYIFTLFDQ